MQSYHIRGVAERQTRGAQNAEGIARAGSNPAAPTIRRQTAYGRFFISSDRSPARGFFHARKPRLNAGRKPVRGSTETYAKKILILFAGEDECLIEK